LVLLAVCLLTACEKVPLTSPTGSTITLSIDKTSVPIGGTAQLVAVVSEASGTAPQNGTMVTFSSAFGTITPQEAPTLGGIARATFTGTSSGVAKVGAFSGPAKATEVELKVGGAAAASVALRAEPATLPQGGGTTTVMAFVRDSAGNPLPNAPVNFTSDQGNLGATAAVTDSNGEARVTITTNRDAVVTANVGGTVTGTVTVRIINAPSVTIALAAGSTPAVGVTTNFVVTPAAVAGGTSIQSVTINWGDGSPEQSLGAISGATNVTHTFNAPGSYNVVATARDATGQQSQSNLAVNVQRIAPVVTITPTNTTAAPGSTVAFSVNATAGTGGPPIQGNITVTENPGGTVVYSGPPGGFARQFTAPGSYTLTARATDTAGTTGSAVATVQVNAAAGPNVTFTHDSAPAQNGQVEVFTVGSTGGTGVVTFRVTLQDGSVLYQGGPGSFTWTPTSAGTATLTAVGTDSAGNSGNRILLVTVNP
jgi:hypothetical protein